MDNGNGNGNGNDNDNDNDNDNGNDNENENENDGNAATATTAVARVAPAAAATATAAAASAAATGAPPGVAPLTGDPAMADYIPAREAELVTYAANLSAKITLNPTSYALTAAIAAQFATTSSNFAAAYAVSQDPATRSPTNITLKNSAKHALISAIRSIARTVQGSGSVTPAMKEGLGLNPRDVVPSPIPAPGVAPDVDVVSVTGRTVRLRLHPAGTAARRGKPAGCSCASIFSFVGAAPPADLTGWTCEGNATRTLLDVQFAPTVPAGSTVWIVARWLNPRAQAGPLSTPVSATLAGGTVTGFTSQAA